METNKIKPYLFWIICGAILVIELVYFMFFLTPTPPKREAGIRPPANAQAARSDAERRLKELDKLKRRAETTIKTPPQSVVMDPSEAGRLTEYIVSKDWEGELNREVEKRKLDLNAIKVELSNRSRSVHLPVSSQTDPVTWYSDYQTASAALVQYLVEERVLALPRVDSGDESKEDAYRSSNELRGTIDLVTADGNEQQFDSEARRVEVSAAFRVVDAVARTIAQVEATPLPHPGIDGFEEIPSPTPSKVTIRSIEVSPGAKADGVGTFTVLIDLDGAPTALLAASRRLDALVDPIAVRLGSTWSRKNFDVRGKHSVSDVPMSYRTELLVLDFFDPALSGN